MTGTVGTPASVQERYAPTSVCFGCGPANPSGLRIRSFRTDAGMEARWLAGPHHEAFPGILAGGIASTLLDCHSNWTAALHLMERDGLDAPPVTVTAELSVRLLRPTPTREPVLIEARVAAERSAGRRVRVIGQLRSGDLLTATSEATFVAVGPGHPAYGAWSVGPPASSDETTDASSEIARATSSGR